MTGDLRFSRQATLTTASGHPPSTTRASMGGGGGIPSIVHQVHQVLWGGKPTYTINSQFYGPYFHSIVGSLRDRQGSNSQSCVWRTVSSQSSHHPQEVLLAQFSLYVHKGGLKPDSFHFIYFHRIFNTSQNISKHVFPGAGPLKILLPLTRLIRPTSKHDHSQNGAIHSCNGWRQTVNT